MRLRWTLIFVFLTVVLVGCGGGEDDLAGFVTLTNEEVGLTVAYPETWTTDAIGAEMIVASDNAVIEGGDYTEAAAVVLFVEPIDKVGGDLLTFMETEIVGDQAIFVVEDPARTEINGLDAVTMLMAQPQGDLDLFLGTTLIRKGEQVAFVLTIYDSDLEDTFSSTLDKIVGSVMFVGE